MSGKKTSSLTKNKITLQRYMARVENAKIFMRDHLGQDISLADIAKASGFSSFHFHRIFYGLTRETPQDYVRRIRMEKAANMLYFKAEKSVTDIALSLGFSSSSNFSKAFKDYFGCTPSQIRNPDAAKDNSKIGAIKSKYGKDFNLEALYPDSITNEKNQENMMDVEIKTLEEKDIAIVASANGYEDEGIFQAWNQLMTWAMQNAPSYDAVEKYGFGYDNPTVTPIDKCRYDASVVVGEHWIVPKHFKTSKIPAGQYAVLYYKGTQEMNAAPHLWLYGEWFPNSGYEPDDYPMFERYLNDVRNDGYVEKEIFVKIKA
tara:strand:+ start:2135 stop:3085 length:951 start_codon:yes stop_codon:yes gene_type:complete